MTGSCPTFEGMNLQCGGQGDAEPRGVRAGCSRVRGQGALSGGGVRLWRSRYDQSVGCEKELGSVPE
jgi:hypothetical protein